LSNVNLKKENMKQIFIIAIALLSSLKITAQQDAEYSMYFFNGLYINPAYAGSKDALHISGLARKQWDGFEGAPRSGSLNIHSPLKKKQYALGFSGTYDVLGTTKNLGLTGSFAYRIRTSGTVKIGLGVQAGVNNYNLEYAKNTTDQGGDNKFAQNNSAWVPNVGLGIYAYNKKFYAGLSAPHLLPSALMDSLAFSATNKIARVYNQYNLTAGYVIGKENSDFKFLPSFMIKYVPDVTLQADITANFIIKEFMMLGASYRTTGDQTSGKGESIIGIVKFAILKDLELGYAYDYTISKLNSYNGGTHEIYVGYTFGSDASKRFVTPRFVTYF
jgi:type IX secretion system PorP/SprF family membrane protein